MEEGLNKGNVSALKRLNITNNRLSQYTVSWHRRPQHKFNISILECPYNKDNTNSKQQITVHYEPTIHFDISINLFNSEIIKENGVSWKYIGWLAQSTFKLHSTHWNTWIKEQNRRSKWCILQQKIRGCDFQTPTTTPRDCYTDVLFCIWKQCLKLSCDRLLYTNSRLRAAFWDPEPTTLRVRTLFISFRIETASVF
jgi:hypothetical protein